MATITVIGGSNTDLVTRVRHLPAPGETVLGGDLARFAGGKGANQAVAARRLGAEVHFVACLGDDAFGDTAWADLARAGIAMECVRRVPDTPSGVALIAVAEDGENSIIVAPGANAHLSAEDVTRAGDAIRASRVVLAQLETPLAATRAAFEIARAAGVRTILNAAPIVPGVADLLPLTDILLCNHAEAVTLADAGSSEIETLVSRLHTLGATWIIITLGKDGAIVSDADGITRIPAFAVPVVDTTGAGDAFAGVLAARLAAGDALRMAARVATAAAALAVGRAGAQPSLPTAARVEAFLVTH